jgi:hypothetical protein
MDWNLVVARKRDAKEQAHLFPHPQNLPHSPSTLKESAMDWNLVIEKNRDALKRIVAMLVAMARRGGLTSPLAGEDGSARRGEAEAQRAKAKPRR